MSHDQLSLPTVHTFVVFSDTITTVSTFDFTIINRNELEDIFALNQQRQKIILKLKTLLYSMCYICTYT